ncbi:transposase [archaeon]|nr:transposase [archaeon]
MKNREKLEKIFPKDLSSRQKQYEALRMLYYEKEKTYEEIANNFNFSEKYLRKIENLALTNKIDFFPEIKKGPKKLTTPKKIINKIIDLRKQNISIYDIKEKILEEDKQDISIGCIQNFLSNTGFDKLKRRTAKQRGVHQKDLLIGKKSTTFDIKETKPFKIDCPNVGVFFFIPYIIESGILDILKTCKLPESSQINSTQAILSFLLLKLIGNERLCHIQKFDQEPVLGIFAGLNILPKSTYISTYSCRTSDIMLQNLQEKIHIKLREKYPQFYESEFINLDFHSIPHYGDESQMEKVWCGAKHQVLKGANTFLAQDGKSDVILFTKADVLRKNETNEIKNFIKYWKDVKKKNIDETLVFDCKLTKYEILDELENKKIKFITLRKRNNKLLEETLDIPDSDWKKVRLDIPKRKYQSFFVHENKTKLGNCENEFRQIIIKGHGREKPTFVITNNWDLKIEKILEVYAKRWHIENKIGEVVAFFNLNALSSPIMVRIQFDIFLTSVADFLYHIFAQDLPRFEKCRAKTIFRKFIDMSGILDFDGKEFVLKIRKRAHTPVLLGVEKLTKPFEIPWIKNTKMKIVWTA